MYRQCCDWWTALDQWSIVECLLCINKKIWSLQGSNLTPAKLQNRNAMIPNVSTPHSSFSRTRGRQQDEKGQPWKLPHHERLNPWRLSFGNKFHLVPTALLQGLQGCISTSGAPTSWVIPSIDFKGFKALPTSGVYPLHKRYQLQDYRLQGFQGRTNIRGTPLTSWAILASGYILQGGSRLYQHLGYIPTLWAIPAWGV